VAGTGEAHELDVDAFRCKAFSELEGLAGVGDAICGAMSEKQALVTQRLNCITRK